MAAQAVNPVNDVNLVTRHERQRSQYVQEQITRVINGNGNLNGDQKLALLQCVAEKIKEMLLNRTFSQGIPIRIAINGNQFNITPPVPVAKVIRNNDKMTAQEYYTKANALENQIAQDASRGSDRGGSGGKDSCVIL